MSRDYDSSSDDDNPSKRRKFSDKVEIEERLESLISRVGDKSTSSSLESNLEGLASVLEADLTNHKKKIFKIILNCAVDLPQRICVYSTLVGLLNANNYSAGADFIEMLMTFFKETLKDNNHSTALHLMHFLSDLTNCRVVMASSVLNFYNIFLEAAMEENVPQVRSDWLVYAVLSCLPWSGKELSNKKEVELDRMLSTVEAYLKRRNRSFVPALLIWRDEEQMAKDNLDTLWIQLQDMRHGNNWRESMLRRPYLAFEMAFRDALEHTIPAVTIPPYDPKFTPLPRLITRIFETTDLPEDCPRLSKSHSIDRFIVEETLHAIIHANYLERKICADTLLSIEFKEKVPLDYLIIEAIFNQLFQVPDSPHLHLMYGVLLIELCRLQHDAMPQVLAQATIILYNRLDTMNITCVQRFAEWFAYHLSNFQFKWTWEDWTDCITADPESPKFKFVQETLKRCLRLSYYQRVVDIVPSVFHKLLPPEPLPVCKYLESDADIYGKEEALKLIEALKNRCSVEEATCIIATIKDEVSGDAGNNPARIDVFIQSLLFVASKTITHSLAAITKYHSTIQSIAEGRSKKEMMQLHICILHSIHSLWINKPQMLTLLVDKFLKTQLVSCAAVIAWIFSPEMIPHLTSFHVYDMLESTVDKLQKQVDKEKKELNKKHSRHSGDDSDEEVASRLNKNITELENLQLSVIENFINILTEHCRNLQSSGRSYKTPWFAAVKDRLLQFVLKCRTSKCFEKLETKLVTISIHESVEEVFRLVQPLMA